MTAFWKRVRLRIDETPEALFIALIAVVMGLYRMVTEAPSLSGFGVLFWLALMMGGSLYIAGRMVPTIRLPALNLQSAGLALMVGSYVFVVLRASANEDGAELFFLIFRYAAICIALAWRLWLVRKAAKAMPRV